MKSPLMIEIDYSSMYLNMCAMASEVQCIHQVGDTPRHLLLTTGNYYLSLSTGRDVDSIRIVETNSEFQQVIWLPMLHQLLAFFHSGLVIDVFQTIATHARKVPMPSYLRKINHHSGEQLLLAWYMRQTYHKVWNGSVWVKDRSLNVSYDQDGEDEANVGRM